MVLVQVLEYAALLLGDDARAEIVIAGLIGSSDVFLIILVDIDCRLAALGLFSALAIAVINKCAGCPIIADRHQSVLSVPGKHLAAAVGHITVIVIGIAGRPHSSHRMRLRPIGISSAVLGHDIADESYLFILLIRIHMPLTMMMIEANIEKMIASEPRTFVLQMAILNENDSRYSSQICSSFLFLTRNFSQGVILKMKRVAFSQTVIKFGPKIINNTPNIKIIAGEIRLLIFPLTPNLFSNHNHRCPRN
jgi:hypothetical protein